VLGEEECDVMDQCPSSTLELFPELTDSRENLAAILSSVHGEERIPLPLPEPPPPPRPKSRGADHGPGFVMYTFFGRLRRV
jgi:hypothetical protein